MMLSSMIPTPPTTPFMRSILVTSLACASSISHASTDWFVCTTDLEIRMIRSPHIESGELNYRDTRGMTHTRSLDEVFFVLPTQQPDHWGYHYQGSGETTKLTLTDQQRFPALLLDTDDAEFVQVLTPFESTPRSVRIESVDHFRVGWIPPEALSSVENDVVRLRSNDLITGFVEFIGEVVLIDTDDQMRTFPIDQVNLIQLANDPAPTPGVYVYIDRDIRLLVTDLESSDADPGSGMMLYLDHSETSSPPTHRPVRVAFEPQRFGGIDIKHRFRNMVPLASLTPDTITPTGDRSWTPDPEQIVTTIPNSGLDDLDLRAPVEIRYTLDQPASRFACDVELNAGLWSDCTLEILTSSSSAEPTTLRSIRLNPDSIKSSVLVDLPEDADELIIRIDPGINGPIQDRVILRMPRLLIEHDLPQFE